MKGGIMENKALSEEEMIRQIRFTMRVPGLEQQERLEKLRQISPEWASKIGKTVKAQEEDLRVDSKTRSMFNEDERKEKARETRRIESRVGTLRTKEREIPDYNPNPDEVKQEKDFSIEKFKKGEKVNFGDGRILTLLKGNGRIPKNLDIDAVDLIRNLDCHFYTDCLDIADQKKCCNFSCLNCCQFH